MAHTISSATISLETPRNYCRLNRLSFPEVSLDKLTGGFPDKLLAEIEVIVDAEIVANPPGMKWLHRWPTPIESDTKWSEQLCSMGEWVKRDIASDVIENEGFPTVLAVTPLVVDAEVNDRCGTFAQFSELLMIVRFR